MEFKPAKQVYFYDKMLDIVLSGKMAAIDNTYDEQCFLLLNVRTINGDFMGSRTVRASKLFDTYDECVDNKNAYNQAIIEAYKNQINSVEDLVRFLYKHPCNGAEEYTEWHAAEAAKQKALELLNIVL